ncbi:hypothetical protein Z043_112029 [Scleropages formosus]|uniref:Uncharacterized protein n=1 Tax=Scleropages formosus TaxID=113540 RepID=A0A0P7U505_SCLFO|nr:hypothetical protein Z043_112029 [Scleropages formosus]
MLLALFIVLKRRDGERLRTDWLDADMRGKSSFSHWNSQAVGRSFWRRNQIHRGEILRLPPPAPGACLCHISPPLFVWELCL